MTERLADITDRIDGVRQLGAVVNAMKGIAAARAHVARTQLHAVDSYAATIAAAMARSLGHEGTAAPTPRAERADTRGLLVFAAEQGFAGAFSERILDHVAAQPAPGAVFLIGTRGLSIARARGMAADWNAALPSQSRGIPRLAHRITTAIYDAVATGRITALDVLHTGWQAGRPTLVTHRLFPIALTDLPPVPRDPPLMHLPEEALLAALGQDYFNAQVCKAALHAFAAENEARMNAMTAAGSQIARELAQYEATLRRVRQEAITAEIIELGTGAAAAGPAR